MDFTIDLDALLSMKRVFEARGGRIGEGELDPGEFYQKLGRYLGQGLTEAQVAQLFMRIYADCGGGISWEEFINYFFLIRAGASLADGGQSWRLAPQDLWRKEWRGSAHKEVVERVRCLTEVERYATCGRDGTLRLWAAARDLHPLQTLCGGAGGGAWLTDCTLLGGGSGAGDSGADSGGQQLAVAAMDRSISFYDATRGAFEYRSRVTCGGSLGAPLCLGQLEAVPSSCSSTAGNGNTGIGADGGGSALGASSRNGGGGGTCIGDSSSSAGGGVSGSGGDDAGGSSQPAQLVWGDTVGGVMLLRAEAPPLHSVHALVARRDYEVLHQGHTDWVTQVEYLPDVGLVSSSLDSSIQVLDLSRGRLAATVRLHKKGVRCFGYSHAFSLVASGGVERSVLLWQPKGNVSRPVGELAGHSAGVCALAVAEEQSQVVTLSQDGMVRLWDLRTHKCMQTVARTDWARAEDSRPTTLCLDPARRRLVTAAHRPAVCELRAAEGERGHDQRLTAALYNSTFSVVVSGDEGGTICLWNAQTGQREGGFSFAAAEAAAAARAAAAPAPMAMEMAAAAAAAGAAAQGLPTTCARQGGQQQQQQERRWRPPS